MRRIALFAFIQLVFLCACGGGSNDLASSASGQTIASAGPNVVSITVDAGPSGTNGGSFNIPFVTLTVCAPGSTTNCQTIDHIEVDTGSYGLRIMSSLINSTLLAALPLETTAGFGVPIVECTRFADGYSWGSMRTADLEISSEKASSIPIQVIGDPSFPTIPSDCSSAGVQEDTVATFGANGILGVGPFAQDCGSACVNATTQPGTYYSCPTGGAACSATQVALNQEAANPVASFTTDNNGVIVEMPSIPDAGSPTATGALVFGIGTESNNALGSATVLTTDQVNGFITITYKGVAYRDSYLDSGSNFNFFNDGSIALCGTAPNQFFCPSSQLTLSATNEGTNNVVSTVSFKVSNVLNSSSSSTFTAFDNVAAPQGTGSQSFDFGLPFFYGRNVFTAIEGKNTSGGMGPYFAY